MTLNEKIESAKKRINELEALIKYWDNTSLPDNNSSSKAEESIEG